MHLSRWMRIVEATYCLMSSAAGYDSLLLVLSRRRHVAIAVLPQSATLSCSTWCPYMYPCLWTRCDQCARKIHSDEDRTAGSKDDDGATGVDEKPEASTSRHSMDSSRAVCYLKLWNPPLSPNEQSGTRKVPSLQATFCRKQKS